MDFNIIPANAYTHDFISLASSEPVAKRNVGGLGPRYSAGVQGQAAAKHWPGAPLSDRSPRWRHFLPFLQAPPRELSEWQDY